MFFAHVLNYFFYSFRVRVEKVRNILGGGKEGIDENESKHTPVSGVLKIHVSREIHTRKNYVPLKA